MTVDRPIAIALILFIVLLIVFFLVVPEYKTFASLQTELGEKKAEFNAEFDYYASIAKIYFELQSRKEDLAKIDDALPKDSNLGQLIYFFQKTAAENGIMVKDLFLSKTSPNNISEEGGSSVKDIIFSMDLIGEYSSLENFLVALEKSSRLFEVTNISFGSALQSSLQPDQQQFQAEGISNFSLQVKTHSY